MPTPHPLHTAPIQPATEANGEPLDPKGFLRDAGMWTRLLCQILAKDRAGLTECVRKMVMDENGKDTSGDPLFHALSGFENMARRCRGLADAFDNGHARLLLAADALDKETAPHRGRKGRAA
jgi:hypothetical protein